MRTQILLKNAILMTIMCLAIITILLVWPGKIWKETYQTNLFQEPYMLTEEVTLEKNVMQEFLPEYEHLNEINIFLTKQTIVDGAFQFRLYDKDLNLLWEVERRFSDFIDQKSGNDIFTYQFFVDMQLYQGQPYYYTVNYVDSTFRVLYIDRDTEVLQGNGTLYYDLQEIPDSSMISNYSYTKDLDSKDVILIDFIVSSIGILMYAFLMVLLRNRYRNKIVYLDDYIGSVLKVLSCLILIISSYFILYKRIFGGELLDLIVYETGVFVLCLYLFFLSLSIRINSIKSIRSFVKRNIANYLQIISFSMCILACIEFVNAGSNYAQGIATRKLAIYFAFAILFKFSVWRRKLTYVFASLYSMAGMIGLFFLMKQFEIGTELYETKLRTYIMLLAWIFVIVLSAYELLNKKMQRSISAWIILGLFFSCLMIFRNSYSWVYMIVLPFGIFYFHPDNQEENISYLRNISNSVILSFSWITVQALLHRPFHYYLYVRYPGMFTTVTVTSVYLAMVFAICFAKVFSGIANKKKIIEFFPNIVMVGIVSGFQVMTLSRTGLLTCFIVGVISIFIFMITNKKISLSKVTTTLMITILIIISSIPMVYTITRVVPAIKNDPIVYEGEQFVESIVKGEKLDSKRYITVERFLGLTTERIFGKQDLSAVTESGKTIEEVLENIDNPGETSLEEEGVVVGEKGITYIDSYGDEYTIETMEYSNGRLDIFKNYVNNLNLEGHDAVGLTLPDGTTIMHAHNSFIQMAYDCGIITGLIFIGLYIYFGVRTIIFYYHTKKIDFISIMPMMIFATFGISSMVEYVFRPTIPLGFLFLLVIKPLTIKLPMYDRKKSEKKIKS